MPDSSRDNNDVGFAPNIQPNIKDHMVFQMAIVVSKLDYFAQKFIYIHWIIIIGRKTTTRKINVFIPSTIRRLDSAVSSLPEKIFINVKLGSVLFFAIPLFHICLL